jgi:uncharacterized protein (TIGR00251 family)
VTAGRPPIVQDGQDVLLAIRVQPRASRNQVVATGGESGRQGPERITIRLTVPPVEGAANTACRSLLADRLGIAQSRIRIVRGETSHNKLLRIRDAEASTILARLRSTD